MIVHLKNLTCPNCGDKICRLAGNLAGVEHAEIDLMGQKLYLALSKTDAQDIFSHVKKIVRQVEPSVKPEWEKEEAGEEHDHAHSHEHGPSGHLKWIRLAIGTGIFILALALSFTWPVNFIAFLLSYIIIGGDVLWRALKNIGRGRIFDENFLMSIATIGAFVIGEYLEGVAVMLFYQVGEMFQDYAVERSRGSIATLMDIRPDYANLFEDGKTRRVAPEEVKIGSRVQVSPGEKIPLDGIVKEGSSFLDTSALTGESAPRSVQVGDAVLSGCVNQSGVLVMEVTAPYGESAVAKVLEQVEHAGRKKAKAENFITRFARIYTPVVVIVAVLLAALPPLITGQPFSDWLYRALVFLVASCPCALVISIPLSFFAGIGGAARKGILIKGGTYMEALARVKKVVMDKTGTLTQGQFAVEQAHSVDMEPEKLLFYAAYAEHASLHPIAQALRQAWPEEIQLSRVKEVEELAGKGVSAKVDEREVLVGNRRLMEERKIPSEDAGVEATVVYVAVEGEYAGYITVKDQMKPDAKEAVESLQTRGIGVHMLTGDSPAVAAQVAAELGIPKDNVRAGLLPDGKVQELEGILASKGDKGSVAFVGDGVNDAPVLARADVGVAMGGLGSDAAIQAADVVLMDDAPSKLPQAVDHARRVMGIVRQNIIFALVIKCAVLVLSAVGIATMWEAVFADVGVSLLAVLNALRGLKNAKTCAH